jgi:hypothetical protein
MAMYVPHILIHFAINLTVKVNVKYVHSDILWINKLAGVLK